MERPRRPRRSAIVCATLSAMAFGASEAAAANLDSFALANDAATCADAVVATTQSGGAAWYNPAGLARVSTTSVDLTATSLVLRVREFSEPLSVRLPTETRSQDVSATDFFSVPTSLVLARRLSDRVVGAFGVFVTRQEFVSANALMQAGDTLPDGRPFSYDLYLDITQQSSVYHLGPSVGWTLTPTLRVGMSLFGVYEKLLAFDQFAARLGVGEEPTVERREVARQVKQTATLFGLRPGVGVQWDFAPEWHLGAMLRGPTVVLSEVTQATVVQTEAASGADPVGSTVRVEGGRDALQRSGPARLHVGLARDVGKGFVALGGDYQGPFYDARGELASDAVWNVRAGARLWPRDDIGLGMGVFTDRSPTPTTTEQTSRARVHYYGVTAGGELLRRYPLRKDNSEILLSTTVAIRYAIGFGSLNGILVEPFSEEFSAYRPNRVDVTLHELLLHIGSSLEL